MRRGITVNLRPQRKSTLNLPRWSMLRKRGIYRKKKDSKFRRGAGTIEKKDRGIRVVIIKKWPMTKKSKSQVTKK